MATLIKSVDKTSVKFTDTFTYTINAAFSGIVGSIDNAKITDFIPDYISYVLPQPIAPIQSITVEAVEGGDLISFNFGTITDTGISVAINIACKFKLGTESQTIFDNEVNMYINDDPLPVETAVCDTVTLDVVEDFIIEKDIAIPTNKQSSPGGRVIYTIILRNKLTTQGGTGDLGARVDDVVITDTLPQGLTLDPNYDVVGTDVSGNAYADNRYNGQTAVVVGNEITFTLPEYYGTKYRIVMVCNVSEDVELETEIPNTSNLEISLEPRGSATTTLTVGDPTYGAYISKYGPNYGSVGNYISYDLSVGNFANQDLIDFIIEEKIPNEVIAYRINTGSFKIDVINEPIVEDYDITYEINNSGQYELLGTYNTQSGVFVALPTLEVGEKITKIKWTIPNFQVGTVQDRAITIDGIITSTNVDNQIVNIGEAVWNGASGTVTAQATSTTVLNDKSQLNVSKSVMNSVNNVVPGDIIRYSVKFNGNGSQVNNAVVSDLLPLKLTYLGNEKYIYYDYFDNTTINSITTPNFFDVVPVDKQVTLDFDGTGRTLVRYNLDGFSLRQRGTFTVEFDVEVKVGVTGVISNNAIVGNKGDNGIVGPGQIPYLDTDDMDEDGITNENLVISTNTNTNVLYYASLSSDKKVKGALDEEYTEEPFVGKTYEGGAIDYKLVVKNTGNLNFEYIEIVDILPHIGDTGVILVNEQRDSEFNVYNIDRVIANIVENDVVIENIDVDIQYSQSYDPVRFSQNNFGDDTIGTVNDWSSQIPNPITATKSVKLTVANKIIQPNQSIVIDMKCLALFGVAIDLVAWNSFAVKATYRNENNILKKLIPVEPEKVGVEVLSSNKASLGGITWLDANENGDIDPGEVGLNGIEVLLLSQDNVILQSTITTNDSENNPGYYLFNNLDIGNYYVQFSKPTGLYYTRYNKNTQNKADTNTGKTKLITIDNETEQILDIDGGYIEEINFVLMILEVLDDDIYSANCETPQAMIESINYAISTLIGITNSLINLWSEDLVSGSITDMAYKAQLQRLIYILRNILSKLVNINIPLDYCNIEVLSSLLYILTEYSLDMINVIEDDEGINSYYGKCSCIGLSFYELLMGRFINDISCLELIPIQLNSILGVLYSTTNVKHQSYTPMYSPKNPIKAPTNRQVQGFACNPNKPCNK